MSYPHQSDQTWPTSSQPYSDHDDGEYPGYPSSDAVQSAGHEYGYGYGYGYSREVAGQKTNALAIASMAVSLASILLCGYPAIGGAIMGHIARRQIRERGESGESMALTGIIAGWLVFGASMLISISYLIFVVSAFYGAGRD